MACRTLSLQFMLRVFDRRASSVRLPSHSPLSALSSEWSISLLLVRLTWKQAHVPLHCCSRVSLKRKLAVWGYRRQTLALAHVRLPLRADLHPYPRKVSTGGIAVPPTHTVNLHVCLPEDETARVTCTGRFSFEKWQWHQCTTDCSRKGAQANNTKRQTLFVLPTNLRRRLFQFCKPATSFLQWTEENIRRVLGATQSCLVPYAKKRLLSTP